MSAFSYKAMNPAGRVIRGQLEALNAVDLEMRLKRMGLDFIDGALVRQRRSRFKQFLQFQRWGLRRPHTAPYNKSYEP